MADLSARLDEMENTNASKIKRIAKDVAELKSTVQELLQGMTNCFGAQVMRVNTTGNADVPDGRNPDESILDPPLEALSKELFSLNGK
jgi:hypothetical protein